jgi:regulatory protein
VSRRSPTTAPSGGEAERDALRWLARRPLTEAELRGRLAAAGHPAATADRLCRRMREAGYLDDRRLAEHFIQARAARLGHGPERLVAELVRRGVPPAVARAAWDAAAAGGDVSAAELLGRQVARRLGPRGRPLDRRAWARQARALVRAGFAAEEVERALAPFRSGAEPAEDEPALEADP